MTFKLGIHSYKGGPGKSTITANIAVSLASQGKRVCGMDLDLAGPGLHVIFELKKEEMKHTLNDILMLKGEPTEAVIDLTERLDIKKGKLLFVPAGYKAEDIMRLLSKGYEVSVFRKAMEEISKEYNLDYLLIDTHPGLAESTLIAMAACDAMLLITRIDNQDIFGTGIVLEVIKALNKPVFLVANMIPPGLEEKKLKARLETMFNVPVMVEIPFYTEVLKALSAGVFALKYPEHEFSAKIKSLTSGILEVKRE